MSLPRQKIPFSQKNEQWRKDTINHFETYLGNSNSRNRNTVYNKRINYDLFNGRFNKFDLEYVCNPLGLKADEYQFPANLQHYDITSPPLNLLIGEETKRPDNTIVISESPNDISRKQNKLKESIMNLLRQKLINEIDPSTVDPNQPLPTPQELVKYALHDVSDMIESRANKMLKYVKKAVDTKDKFKRGFKDAIIAGEEIYWTGVSGDNIMFRKCNPLNITLELDGDSESIDDAVVVIEERMMTPSSILDEFNSDLTPDQVEKIERLAVRITPFTSSVTNNIFRVEDIQGQGAVVDNGNMSNFSSTPQATNLIRILRFEWKSFKKLYHITYLDDDGNQVEDIVDESFNQSIFKKAYPTLKCEEFWVNEAWEGIKIGHEIYICIRPKVNQRRRMDDPSYCKLGYVGGIYNSTNSMSVSLIDRIKPYQYLYNVISYRLELAFAQDQGKKVVVDLAQIPRSEGIDLDQWMYYLKALGIMFINSFEEQRKGSAIGKYSSFNQFSSIDLSMANTIQGYIDTLNYIKSQVYFISGVTPQRMGAIANDELVGNVEKAVTQSSLITEYLYDTHDEIKRRVYTALVECAKIAFKHGKIAQYVLDDMGLELLEIEELEFEDSEFNVFMSNSNKDQRLVESLKQLSVEALKADKINLSSIIDTLINDNPKDISSTIKRGEQEKYDRDKATQDQQANIEQQKIQAQQQMQQIEMQERQKDRDLKQYEVDQNNETKITVQELANYFKAAETDSNSNGIPDPIEIADHALAERELQSNEFRDLHKLNLEKQKHDNEHERKKTELQLKSDIENKKIEQIKAQNASQEKMQNAKIDNDSKLKQLELQKEAKRLQVEKQMHDNEMKLKDKELKLKEKENTTQERMEKLKLQMIEKKAKADELKHKMDQKKQALDLKSKTQALKNKNSKSK